MRNARFLRDTFATVREVIKLIEIDGWYLDW